MINTVILVGRAGQDPEMRYFESGKVKTTFSIAVSRWSKTGEITDWFNIELWDKQAEVAGQYVKKGSLIALDGRLAIDKWSAKDGTERERAIVRGNNLRLLGSKKDQG